MDQETDVLEFRELEDPNGGPPRRLIVTGAEFIPLGYDELATLTGPTTIPLRWRNAKIVETDIPGVGAGQIASGTATLQSPFTSKAIGLVNGGWLPSALAAHNDTLVLPDRCVVTELRGRFRDGVKRNSRKGDFLDLFADKPVRINPLFFALEGNSRRIPTDEEVHQQIQEAAAHLRTALPRATLVATNELGLKGALGLIRDSTPRLQREQAFLMQLAPRLTAPVSSLKANQRWNEALTIAKNCGVQKTSLTLLAVLSSVLSLNGNSPSKRLLKFGPNYSEADAYNALADLRSLDILMHLFARFPRERVMLCTTDRDLALFWVGLKASNFIALQGGMRFDISPAVLLPSVTDAQMDSLKRLD